MENNNTNPGNFNGYPNQQNPAQQETPSPGGEFNLKHIFNKYFLRHWYLYIYTLVLAMITAYFYNWYATPIYYTSTTVLVKDPRQKTGNDLLSKLDAYDNTGTMDNEIGIIRSRALIRKTLTELQLDKSYYLKGDVKTSELYKESPIELDADTLYKNAINSSLNIRIVNASKYKIIKGDRVTIYSFNQTVVHSIGKFRIKKTGLFIDKYYNNKNAEKVNIIIRINDLDVLTDSYQTALKVEPVSKQASLLQISMQGPVKAKTEDFLNKHCDVFIKKGTENKNEYAVNTLKFIDEQLELLTRDIDINEASVEGFRVKKGITDLNIEAGSYLEAVKSFDYKISEIQVQISFLDYLEKYLTNGNELTGNISPSTIMVNDPSLQNMVIKLSELENQRKAKASIIKSNNPIIKQLSDEITNTRAQILETIRSSRNGMSASLNEAQTQKAAIQSKLRLLPSAQRELTSLMRGSNIKETLYQYLLQKKAETAILLASTTADNRVVDPARTFPKPLKPVKSLTYSVALLLGLLLPAVIIYARDLMNDKISDRFELERITKIPILGMIGLSASKSSLVVTEKPNSHISEAFRSIRTNLQYFSQNKEKNVIMITSSISSEGKSFCSLNLAVMMSLSGRKTILVGCDLRKPKITVGFDFTSEVGLSNYLIGIATENEVIQNSGTIPNLDIILSGPKPPNPSELIISKKMDELFVYLRQHYDYIILDTPPIGLITDAMVLSKYADVTVYVVRQSVTRKHHLNFINNLYTEGKIKNICIILNALRASNKNYGYGYEYAYGYGYGYGYGYYEEDKHEKGIGAAFRSIFSRKKVS
jgi:tyrosine-protein kinase Etk/Wzc